MPGLSENAPTLCPSRMCRCILPAILTAFLTPGLRSQLCLSLAAMLTCADGNKPSQARQSPAVLLASRMQRCVMAAMQKHSGIEVLSHQTFVSPLQQHLHLHAQMGLSSMQGNAMASIEKFRFSEMSSHSTCVSKSLSAAAYASAGF